MKSYWGILILVGVLYYSQIGYAQPAKFTYMEKQIADHLALLKKGEATAERGAFWDYCLPIDESEFSAVGGNGLLLVTAISHDKAELPLKRVYFKDDEQEIVLTSYKRLISEYPSDSDVAKMYGQFRVDEMFLLPGSVELKGDVFVDFSVNREGFSLGLTAEGIPWPSYRSNPVGEINPLALELFVAREYPGFLDEE
jgi:hypothetical protein